MELSFCINGFCPVWDAWAAIGTFLAAFVALFIAVFGDALRTALFKPRFELVLRKGAGAVAKLGGHGHFVNAHFFHLRVRNAAHFAKATNVRVVLNEVHYLESDSWQLLTKPELQAKWKFHEAGPVMRTISPQMEELVDAFFVTENGLFELSLVQTPSHLHGLIQMLRDVKLTYQIISEECVSRPFVLKIKWTGEFDVDREAQEETFAFEQSWADRTTAATNMA